MAKTQQNGQLTRSDMKVAIESTQIFAWWSGKQVRLERWKDTRDPKVPHPKSFDVICQIRNEGLSAIQDGDLIILTTLESVVAPTYLHGGDLKAIMNEVHWSREAAVDDLKLEKVPYLQSNSTAQIEIKGFDLGNLLQQFNGENDTLWPWALRVNVRILSRDMTQVALGQVVLPMIPADSRLAAK